MNDAKYTDLHLFSEQVQHSQQQSKVLSLDTLFAPVWTSTLSRVVPCTSALYRLGLGVPRGGLQQMHYYPNNYVHQLSQ